MFKNLRILTTGLFKQCFDALNKLIDNPLSSKFRDDNWWEDFEYDDNLIKDIERAVSLLKVTGSSPIVEVLNSSGVNSLEFDVPFLQTLWISAEAGPSDCGWYIEGSITGSEFFNLTAGDETFITSANTTSGYTHPNIKGLSKIKITTTSGGDITFNIVFG